MRSLLATLAFASAIVAASTPNVAAATAAATTANAPNVPIGVDIPVALSATVSSATAHRGGAFTFATTKDENLGGLAVPKGTPGIGRIAAVSKAYKGHNGSVSLQADMLQVAGGRRIWVNITPRALRGHYTTRHVFPYILPIPPLIFPGAVFTRTGDLILDQGTAFTVVTTAPRDRLAPLVGGAASTTPAPSPSPPMASSPAPTSPASP